MPKALFLLDSIAHIRPDMAQAVVVSGSHGGVSAAQFVLALAPDLPLAVFFNDAGIGKDAAGTAALDLLEDKGVICACYSHTSARIGDAQDGLDHGQISCVNRHAEQSGIARDDKVSEKVRALLT
jgi:hypothetical protein